MINRERAILLSHYHNIERVLHNQGFFLVTFLGTLTYGDDTLEL